MRLVALLLVLFAIAAPLRAAEPPPKPNVIFILADDMGYGDAGCYGQRKIKTPNIDRLAAEGIRFTNAYCGTSVCAPSRTTLMTGLHVGHAPIRGNQEVKPEGQFPLPAGTFTVAHLLRSAGYRTACIGKWGLGYPGSTGTPDKMGFDYFFGYNCQREAHNYYPDHLWRNDQRVELDGKTYSHDLMAADALKYVRENAADAAKPFFLYLAFTIPHPNLQVPDVEPYANESWPEPQKKYAAMITRMDRDIGRLLDAIKDAGADERTLVFFASDNGPNREGGTVPEFFQSAGTYHGVSLRGIKRDLYEGGIREPMIVRWPGHVSAGKVSDEPWVFYDFLPTMAALTGATVPASVKLDGISVLPALLGGPLPPREYIYWELHEGPTKRAVRTGDWKGVQNGPNKPVELYDLKADPGEQHDLAASQSDVLKKVTALLDACHVEDPNWPTRAAGKNAAK